ncbi:MAG TPA: radical SAM protein [Xanthobacteraceae bacterium]|nr:radical SAM protein [Xanthobacteraceae bacterium]
MAGAVQVERVSIELTQRCHKACWFCYSASHARGGTEFRPDEVTAFVRDLAAHGVRAVSFGGGEPLEYDGLFDILRDLRGVLFRSLTTNGLLLRDDRVVAALVAAAPDKVHVSIHFPERDSEVRRVISQVTMLAARGVRSGVNLLVARSNLAAAREAVMRLDAAGIGADRRVLLPMRGQDTPSAAQMAEVAGGNRFQSMTCLMACDKSPRFCAVAWDKTVAWCSYTSERRALSSPTYAALKTALADLGVTFCGGIDDDDVSFRHGLPGRPQHGYGLVRG